ncbi:IS1182 family transposase, partial [Bizionia hallyeonensis]
INTIGIKQANKVMHLAAMAYNLKKYLKFTQKMSKTKAKALGLVISKINGLQNEISFNFHQPNFN